MGRTELVVRIPALPDDLSARDRWDLEDKIDAALDYGVDVRGALRQINDDELRAWVAEGKTQTWIAEQVGRSTTRISERIARLGIKVPKGKGTKGGRPKKAVSGGGNSDSEEDDADPEEPDAVSIRHREALIIIARQTRIAAEDAEHLDLDRILDVISPDERDDALRKLERGLRDLGRFKRALRAAIRAA